MSVESDHRLRDIGAEIRCLQTGLHKSNLDQQFSHINITAEEYSENSEEYNSESSCRTMSDYSGTSCDASGEVSYNVIDNNKQLNNKQHIHRVPNISKEPDQLYAPPPIHQSQQRTGGGVGGGMMVGGGVCEGGEGVDGWASAEVDVHFQQLAEEWSQRLHEEKQLHISELKRREKEYSKLVSQLERQHSSEIINLRQDIVNYSKQAEDNLFKFMDLDGVYQRTLSDMQSCRLRMDDMERESSESRHTIEQLHKQNLRLEGDRSMHEQRADAASIEVERSRDCRREIEKKLDDVKEMTHEHERRKHAVEEELRMLEDKYKQSCDTVRALQSELHDATKEGRKARTEYVELRDSLETQIARREGLERHVTKLTEDLKEKETQCKTLQIEVNSLTTERGNITREINKIKIDNDTQKADVSKLKMQYDCANREIDDLKALNNKQSIELRSLTCENSELKCIVARLSRQSQLASQAFTPNTYTHTHTHTHTNGEDALSRNYHKLHSNSLMPHSHAAGVNSFHHHSHTHTHTHIHPHTQISTLTDIPIPPIPAPVTHSPHTHTHTQTQTQSTTVPTVASVAAAETREAQTRSHVIIQPSITTIPPPTRRNNNTPPTINNSRNIKTHTHTPSPPERPPAGILSTLSMAKIHERSPPPFGTDREKNDMTHERSNSVLLDDQLLKLSVEKQTLESQLSKLPISGE
eukprot:GHVR01132799.1.p1 GENE.GHVR01132799.1~~GHVR01132799.1.p1  ORF type:complete len:697 (+),score=253.48 GHVR01132799.1:55-2145(+)